MADEPPPTESPGSARLAVLAAALLFSTGGAAIKWTDFGSWQVACLRSGIAALVILALIPASRRGWNAKVIGVAVAYGATLTLFVIANKLTTAANTIFLQSTAPLYVLLLGPWLLKERIRSRDWIVLALLAAGMAMFLLGQESPSRTAPDPRLGDLLAASAGITWALTLIGLRSLARDGVHAVKAVLLGSVLSCLWSLPFAWPLAAGSAVDWGVIVFLGVFQTGLAYALLTRALPRVPALEASLLLMAEPVLNPVWAFLAHGEQPATLSLLGGAIVLTALCWRR